MTFRGFLMVLTSVGLMAGIAGCSQEQTTTQDAAQAAASEELSVGMIDDQRIIDADDEPGNWLAYGRTYEEQRFSPLQQINKTSVKDLGLAWYKDMGTNRALEAYSDCCRRHDVFYQYLEPGLCG